MVVSVLALAGAAQAQAPTKKPAEAAQAAPDKKAPDGKKAAETPEPESWTSEARRKSMEIGTQPVRDVGISKRDVPPILEKAAADPYSLKGLKTCKQLAAEVTSLNAVLGRDYAVGNEYKENRAGKLAEAGGKTVVNAIIPFRGLVREVSGAAPAERRLNAALDAGFARRGFLRGVHVKQGCKTTF